MSDNRVKYTRRVYKSLQRVYSLVFLNTATRPRLWSVSQWNDDCRMLTASHALVSHWLHSPKRMHLKVAVQAYVQRLEPT